MAQDISKYDSVTYQHKRGMGETPICVYGWTTYTSGVLAGQPQKCFLDAFADADEALAQYPTAQASNSMIEPKVSLSHLPGENDPVPGGMYPDDI